MTKSQVVTSNHKYAFGDGSVEIGLWSRIGQALVRWDLVIFLSALLLGRAEILSEVSPFVLPFFGVVFLYHKEKAGIVLLGVLVGSMTLSFNHFIFVSSGLFLFLLSQAIIKRKVKHYKGILPGQVFFITLIIQPIIQYVSTGEVRIFDLLTITIEASLALILSFIFIYSVPILIERGINRNVEIEEVICLILLVGSVVTGTSGWSIYGVEIQNILTRYFVLVAACVGGAAIGATVGVVMGMVLGLGLFSNIYQMSLLSFSGLLSGLLKESKKLFISFGLLVGTALISLYGFNEMNLITTFTETIIAMVLLVATPREAMNNMAKYLPNTQEREEENNQYIRKLRDLTAQRVSQFANVFSALSSSFKHSVETEEEIHMGSDEAMELFLSKVAEKSCQSCVKSEVCGLYYRNKVPFEMAKRVVEVIDSKSYIRNEQLLDNFENMCINYKKVYSIIETEYPYFKANLSLRTKIQESRKLVADQLQGVSEVMTSFAEEIVKEEENHRKQEYQVIDSFRKVGVELKDLKIYRPDKGRVDVEIIMEACQGLGTSEKIVAPMLSSIFKDHIIVLNEECYGDYCKAQFGSAQKYITETSVTTVAKNGGFTSGDSYSIIELGGGKQALAISDGMGNGEKAHIESTETLRLLKRILKTGIDEEVAIKTINSILALRTTDEIYSTLDLTMIDLHNGSSKMLKIGATPSFVKRGKKVIEIKSSNLPMGIIKDIDLDKVDFQFKEGDILVMASDGIYEGPNHVENFNIWMNRKLRELTLTDTQKIADYFVDSIISSNEDLIKDDMTIIVTKFKSNSPKWAKIDLSSSA